ncbi:MAG TPA: M15 family metallopeptidase [Actinomycetota bacterium]
MIHRGDIVVRSFARIGWEWGGDWVTLKDYMHFSLTGR